MVSDDVAFSIDGGAAGLVAADIDGRAMIAVTVGFGLRDRSKDDEGQGCDCC